MAAVSSSSARIRRIRVERARGTTRATTSTRCTQRRHEWRGDDDSGEEMAQSRRTGLVMAMTSLIASIDMWRRRDHHSARADTNSYENKQTGLSVEEIKGILAEDLAVRQYFVTGNLTQAIWRDDAVFADPTNKTVGTQKYVSVCKQLFDEQCSAVRLLDINIISPTSIRARWTLRGVLKLPWRPRVREFEGSVVYTIRDDGLIVNQTEEWSVSPAEALLETITPGAERTSC